MKELLLIVFISSIGMNFSFGNKPQAYPVKSKIILSDIQVTHERKVQRLMNCEKDIYHLPHDVSYIRGTLIPEMEAQRLILAPNYPETDGVFGAAKESLISDWILNHESEYDQFVVYYETLIRSNS